MNIEATLKNMDKPIQFIEEDWLQLSDFRIHECH